MKLRRKRADSEIPTSSMADIAFLLIIYFMLTATLTATRGLDFSLPPEDEEVREVDPVESVLVEVSSDGSLTVDGRPMPLASLLPYLEPRLTRNPAKPVIVKTAPAAPYGAMIEVLDELRQGRQRLNLERDIFISIPTEREITLFWG